MFKKFISLLMICAMLVPLSPVVAADEPSSQPTIEEILNGYHQKAFEERNAEQNGAASTYSRRAGSEKTLEQETVDELTAAGYEAYNVTADSYDTIESALNTDLSAMGIEADGSYIVVVSGDDNSEATSNSSSRASDVVLPPHYDYEDGAGVSYFTYTYGDNTMKMRYVTVTAADNINMAKSSSVPLYTLGLIDSDTFIEEGFNYLIFAALENNKITATVGTLLTLFGVDFDVIQQTYISTLTFNAGTNWTRKYAQVYNETTEEWVPWASYSYATLFSSVTGIVYSASDNQYVSYVGDEVTNYLYSVYYGDNDWLKRNAAMGHLYKIETHDATGSVRYYYLDDKSDEQVVVTHNETA